MKWVFFPKNRYYISMDKRECPFYRGVLLWCKFDVLFCWVSGKEWFVNLRDHILSFSLHVKI